MIKRTLQLSAFPAARAATVILAAIFVLLSGASASAQEREIVYRDRVSGVAAPTAFDINGDGVPGHYITYDGWSTLGIVNGGLLVEYDFAATPAPDPGCPPNMVRIPILASAGNRALTVRGLGTPGGQVYVRDDHESGLFCVDPTTGAVWMSLKGTFEGGLGILEGASGEYSYEGVGRVMLLDSSMLPFGAFTLETSGTMVLPPGSRVN